MFKRNNKIRQLEELLKKGEPREVIEALKEQNQAGFSNQFKNNLKNTIMAKHNEKAKAESPSPRPSPGGRGRMTGDRRLGLLGSLGGALALLIVVTAVTFPIWPAPEVKGYILKNSSREVSYNAPIKITFSQMMDHGSVEKAFAIDPKIDGSFSWNGNTLSFMPSTQFKIGDHYSVKISSSAKSLLQKHLTSDYQENYVIVKSPEAVLITPNDGSVDVPLDTKITVMFDRPLTELTTLDQSDTKFPRMEITPYVSGRMRWLGTSSFEFLPDKLNLATEYSVKIPMGTESLDGGKTEKDFTTTFQTARPMFTYLGSSDESMYYSGVNLEMAFTQKIDLGSLKEKMKIYRFEGSLEDLNKIARPSAELQKENPGQWKEVGYSLRYATLHDFRDQQKRSSLRYAEENPEIKEVAPATTSIIVARRESPAAGTEEYLPSIGELEKTVKVITDQPLQNASAYLVLADTGVKPFEGPLTIQTPFSAEFQTIGEFKLTQKIVRDNFHDKPTFVFTNRLSLRSFKGKIQIEPTIKDREGKDLEMNLALSDGGNAIAVEMPFKPSTHYKITLLPGGKDILGNELKNPPPGPLPGGEGEILEFDTPALPSRLSLKTNGDITLIDGSAKKFFYFTSVNVKNVDVKLMKLNSEQFLSAYQNGYVDYAGLNVDMSTPDYQAFMPVKADQNEYKTSKIDFDSWNNFGMASGFYYLEMSSPQVLDYNDKPAITKQLFVVTKYSMAIKMSQDKMLVWVTDLKNGEPVKGVKVVLNQLDGAVSAVTDGDGLAKINLPQTDPGIYYREFSVFGSSGDEITFANTSWSEGVAPWNFNISMNLFPPMYYSYLYTDRPIYRPGNEVSFKGIVRKDLDARLVLPDVKEVLMVISDGSGNEIYNKKLKLNANGTFNDTLKISDNVATGDFGMRASLVDAKGPEWDANFYSSFKVAEYRKPDYKLNITADKEKYINGDNAKIRVEAGYYFGAPLPDSTVRWTLKSVDYFYILPEILMSKLGEGWFSFSEDGYSCYWGCQSGNSLVSSGEGKTDSNGFFEMSLPLKLADTAKTSQIYTLEVTVSDPNNQAVSNRSAFTLYQGEFALGVRSNDYIVEAGKSAKFDLVAVKSLDDTLVSGLHAKMTLLARKWNTVKRRNLDGGFYFENNYEDKEIESKNIVTGSNGLGSAEFNIKEAGEYLVKVEGTDSKGNRVSASTFVYVSGEGYANWGQQNNDKLEMATDKQEYKIGETAKILIKSPYKGVKALLTVERGEVMTSQIIDLKTNSETIEIPIKENYLPNVFVSVVVMKGNSYDAGLVEPPLGSNDERQVASFKAGYTVLQVNSEGKKLMIDLKSDKQKYLPRDKVKLSLSTTDTSGKPVPAEVSISVVDESVLALTENITADLINIFYRQRSLGVAFAESMTKALSRVNVVVEAGLKGGGGGAAGKRGFFKDTAFFQAVVNTDENGQKTVEFELPDNLTSWQVLAIGISDDSKNTKATTRTLVGSAKITFTETKELLIQPGLPRFLTAGDRMTVGAMIFNYTDQDQNVDVELKASGVSLESAAKQNIQLAKDSSKKVEYIIKVKDGIPHPNPLPTPWRGRPEGEGATGSVENSVSAEASFEFIAQANGIMSTDQPAGPRDDIEIKLPIKQASFPTFVTTNQIFSDQNKHAETVWLPKGLNLNSGKLLVSVNATLSGSLQDGLEYLISYPYGCMEQIASSMLPGAALKKLVDTGKFKISEKKMKELKNNIETGLQTIYKYQNSNGSWGLWWGSRQNTYVTAYVLYAMVQAQEAGFSVDKNSINRAAGYLKLPDSVVKGLDDRPMELKAFVQFVLAEIGQGDLGALNNVYDHQKELTTVASKAYLAMAFKKVAGDNKAVAAKIDTLKKAVENLASQTPRGVQIIEKNPSYYHFDTDNKTTSLALMMFNRIDPASPLIPKLLTHLLQEKQGNSYGTTHETAYTLLAMIEYFKTSGELNAAYNFEIALNGVNKLTGKFTSENLFETQSMEIPLKEMLANNLDNEITALMSGTGKLYFNLGLTYYLPLDLVKAEDKGIQISQQYFAADDKKEMNPLRSAKVGDSLMAKMKIIVPEDRYYVMVEDFIPAGLEGVDFTLKTSQQALQDLGYGENEWTWYFNHTEVRDDRMMYFADFLPRGVYEITYYLRATSKGEFADAPAVAQETYFPEVFGRTAAGWFSVTE